MTALEVVSLIRDIALIVAGVTVTIVSAVLLQKSNRLLERLEASFDRIAAVGRGIGQVTQAVVDAALPAVSSAAHQVKTATGIFGMALRAFRRRKQAL